MYSPTLTDPIRQELHSAGVPELTDETAVASFIENTQTPTKAVLINSVCGCAAGTARPGFFQSLNATPKPAAVASVFAGVDQAAVAKLRTYLPGIPPSSPSIAFFRHDDPVYFLSRQAIEGAANDTLLAESIALIYKKYFATAIDESIEIKEPAELLERSPAAVTTLLSAQQTTLLDCRSPTEHQQAAIQPSTLLSKQLAQELLTSWDKDKDLTFYCQQGELSLRAAIYFRQNGFTNTFSLKGGMAAWTPTS